VQYVKTLTSLSGQASVVRDRETELLDERSALTGS
jgi:hypothetical protein